jgi:hypothetical protein
MAPLHNLLKAASLSFVTVPVSPRWPYLRPGRRPLFGSGQATVAATSHPAGGIGEPLRFSVATAAPISLQLTFELKIFRLNWEYSKLTGMIY